MPDEAQQSVTVEQPAATVEQPSEIHKIEAIVDDWYMKYIHPHVLSMDASVVAKIQGAAAALKQKVKLIFP